MTAMNPRMGEIEARLSRATTGPWEARGLAYNSTVGKVGEYRNLARLGDPLDSAGWRNAEFIAAAPTDIAYLLAELRARDEKLARVEALHTEDLFRGHLSNGCKTCGNGDHGYPCPTAAAVAGAGGDGGLVSEAREEAKRLIGEPTILHEATA